MIKPKHILLVLVYLLFNGCAHNAGKWQRKGIIPKKDTFSYFIHSQNKDSVKIFYTGCGGLVIAKGNEGIMTDPYYTSHGLLKVMFGKIHINKRTHANVMASIKKNIIDPKEISTVLVAHSHYDHLEDLPYMMNYATLSNTLQITGSSSTYCTIRPFMNNSYRYLNADTFCYRQNPPNTYNRFWDTVSPHIRILTIEAAHAPHFTKYISLMTGSTCRKGLSALKDGSAKTSALDWKVGTTFSFLVDILDGKGGISLRLFIQSSSCSSPYGLPPENLIQEKTIDLAIIGVASAQNIDGYPDDLLKRLNTNKLMLIHWEDFFKNMYKKNPRSVAGTKVGPFLNSVKKYFGKEKINELTGFVIMPKPLSLATVYY